MFRNYGIPYSQPKLLDPLVIIVQLLLNKWIKLPKFMQKHRFYVRLCYDMIFFLNKCQLLKEFDAIIAVH